MAARRSAAGDRSSAVNKLRGAVIFLLQRTAALVFGYAGLSKIRSPQPFADSIAAFRLLPASINNLLALGLPPFELLVGLLLLIGWQTRVAAFGGLAATGVFFFALVTALARSLPVECGCFGDTHSSLAPALRLWLGIGRDVFLMGALLIIYLDAKSRKSHPVSQTDRGVQSPGL